jgi:hypothetical protein
VTTEPRLISVGPTLTRFPGQPKLPAPHGARRCENASMTTWARTAIAAAESAAEPIGPWAGALEPERRWFLAASVCQALTQGKPVSDPLYTFSDSSG